MRAGDYVEWDLSPEVVAIGEVVGVRDGEVDVIEAHAFHYIWCGSNAERGRRVTQGFDTVRPVRTEWKHIVKSGMEAYRRNPEKCDKYRAEMARLRERTLAP